jgi:hypothetical protein
LKQEILFGFICYVRVDWNRKSLSDFSDTLSMVYINKKSLAVYLRREIHSTHRYPCCGINVLC